MVPGLGEMLFDVLGSMCGCNLHPPLAAAFCTM
jgi:hypothetical protein